MTRRWGVSEPFEVEGLSWRVVKGGKTPKGEETPTGDLKLEHLTPCGWRPTAMSMAFLLVDFWYENEEVLYPKPRYQGGDYLMGELHRAARQGWQAAQAQLQKDRGITRLGD